MLKSIKTPLLLAGTILCGAIVSSCDNSTEIGGALVTDESEVVVAKEFELVGRSVANEAVQSRTVTQVLGLIKADGYGTFESEYVTQFMPSSKLVTEGVTVDDIDSLKLEMYVPKGSLVGDSLIPMGFEVYALNKQLPAPIYSNFDPKDYYDPKDLLASKIYICNAIGATDSIKNLAYRQIDVQLPLSLGKELFQLYLDKPEVFSFPSTFAQYFPGIYVKNSFGSGRVMAITSTAMRMYYHTTSTDSEGKEVINRASGTYFAVTPEVIINNNISYTIDSELQKRIDDGAKIIVAPVGRDIELEFPIHEVIDYYQANKGSLSVINTLSLTLPAKEVDNDYGIQPPSNLLLILKSKKDEFFRNNKLNDNITSFYATYDSENHIYLFSGMRDYLLDMLKKDEITAEDYTFVITPVNIETESNSSNSYYGSTTTYVSAINPYVGQPTMVELTIDNSNIALTFSKQTVK